MSAWFATPLGRHLLAREFEFFDQQVVDTFGFHALQLGVSDIDFLRANRMPHRAILSPDEADASIRADYCDLPVATASVDLVALPHTLEFSQNPHQVLREVQRILVPEGNIVLSAFNPWSLWGAARLARRGDPGYPWCGQFISLPRIKDWMALLGFEVSAGEMGAYRPPCRREAWLERLAFMEYAGNRWWPFGGGVYFLRGIKRVRGANMITPKWRMASSRKKVLAAVPQKLVHLDAAKRSACERRAELESR
ncbi:MAG: methyltransferase domain-containing protein [Betaproteobacteria bacterium]|nr:methyltransferase domain-containing protein [Betaproteobacteria bacterium]